MPKLAKLAVLAVLFVPAFASAQVSLGVRLGYAFAMGDAMQDVKLSDGVSAQIPLQLDLGYRVTRSVTLGGYFSYAMGREGDECSGCSIRQYRLGAEVDYTFQSASAAPWIGAGIGYEWMTVEDDLNEAHFKGFEFLNLQGGVDWKMGAKSAIGPFASIAIGRYSTIGDGSVTVDIADKTFHQWLQIGVRGRFDL